MEWLKSVLPTVAAAFGGPLAGVAATFVADKLGLSDKSIEAVKSAIAGATPETLVALKQIDADLSKFFVEADIKIETIFADDRDSARKANVQGGVSRDVFYLTCTIIAAYFGIQGWIMFNGFPATASPELFGRILGSLDAVAMAAIWYTYGTTRDSSKKTDAMIASTKEKHNV